MQGIALQKRPLFVIFLSCLGFGDDADELYGPRLFFLDVAVKKLEEEKTAADFTQCRRPFQF
jgi:hypothetical protein